MRKDNAGLNSLLPFAVVGSTDFVTKEDGRLVRARRYPWGIVEGILFRKNNKVYIIITKF